VLGHPSRGADIGVCLGSIKSKWSIFFGRGKPKKAKRNHTIVGGGSLMKPSKPKDNAERTESEKTKTLKGTWVEKGTKKEKKRRGKREIGTEGAFDGELTMVRGTKQNKQVGDL